jgi:hypothetical protein
VSDALYLVDGDSLTPMQPSAPPDEDKLQDLIARYSELIGDDGDLLLVGREQSVSDSEDGTSRWSLDHLFVTREAIPVLVEVKRAVDTRLRREVVGQLLDYAANGSAYWSAADAAQSFANKCLEEGTEPATTLSEFLGDPEKEAGFWDSVESNLRDGRLKLLIVADRIPSELARIVEFLNDQMRAEVRAIELRYFESVDGRLTLAPRTIGQTEKTKVKKGSGERRGPISIEAWIERDIAPSGREVVSGVARWMEIVHRLGGSTAVASTQGSIVGKVRSRDGKNRYPAFMHRPGHVSIPFGWTHHLPGLEDVEVRQEFLDRFNAAIGPLTTSNLKGFPSFQVERLNEPARAQAYEAVLSDFFKAVLFEPEITE